MVATVDEFKVIEKVTAADDGTLTLPSEVRDVLKFKPGEELMLFETAQGVLISTKKRIVNWALDSIGAELRANGVTLEELIESGRVIRGDLLWEMYGIRASDDECCRR